MRRRAGDGPSRDTRANGHRVSHRAERQPQSHSSPQSAALAFGVDCIMPYNSQLKLSQLHILSLSSCKGLSPSRDLTLQRSMPRHVSSDDDDEPLDDKTVAIPLHNKRTERLQRKKATRDKRRDAIINLAKLPTEIILEAVKCLRPSEVLNLALVNRRLHSIVHANANIIGDFIIKLRYPILAQCFPLPKRLSEVSPPIADLLRDPARQTNLSIHKKPYSHIQPPDAQVLCTCLTCILTWNNLGLALDFAHWQDNLDSGEPIPTLPRGKTLDWNEELVAQNANIVRKAVTESLWHARILEIHLDSTIRSIRRHALNKGNRRKHVEMTEEEAAEGTDHLLEKPGPLSLEFPFHRDNYYLLWASYISSSTRVLIQWQRSLPP